VKRFARLAQVGSEKMCHLPDAPNPTTGYAFLDLGGKQDRR
jgi:hypothetical protein